MSNEVMDESLRRLIKRRAIKCGCDMDGDLVSYGGRLYWVDIKRNIVVEQNTRR